MASVRLPGSTAEASATCRPAARASARDDLSDADVAVLNAQRANAEPLTEEELAIAIPCNTEVPLQAIESARHWQRVLEIDEYQR
jgi:uncharacterized protein